MMSSLKKIVAATATLCALTVAPFAHAGLVTFDIKWTNLSGITTATAELTLDSALIATAPALPVQIDADLLHSFTLTVNGATGGNGVYDKSNFDAIAFYSMGKLNFNQELIGQHILVGSGPYAQERIFGDRDGLSGAFDLFALNKFAPSTVRPFAVITDSTAAYSDYLTVSSIMARDSVSAVPEPETYAMLLAGLGLLAWRARRLR
jgi:PEP-CTERM motif